MTFQINVSVSLSSMEKSPSDCRLGRNNTCNPFTPRCIGELYLLVILLSGQNILRTKTVVMTKTCAAESSKFNSLIPKGAFLPYSTISDSGAVFGCLCTSVWLERPRLTFDIFLFNLLGVWCDWTGEKLWWANTRYTYWSGIIIFIVYF